MAIYMAQGW